MLIEVKAKVSWVIDNKIRKTVETYVIDNEIFAQAEYAIMSLLSTFRQEGTVDSFEIQSLKISAIKEVMLQYQGNYSYIATLRDTIHQDDGTEKQIKYKVLLRANNISEAMSNTRNIVSQGYDMQVDSLREVNYTYLNPTDSNGNSNPTED